MSQKTNLARWIATGICFGLALVGASIAAACLVRAMDFDTTWQVSAALTVPACAYLAVAIYSDS